MSLLAACAQRPLDGIDQQGLNDAVRAQPVVLLGEVHDNAAQHALRAQALRRLLEGGARPVLLMEQFDRERQTDLDRALAQPGATADDVIAAATRADPAMQGWTWPFYKPYIALAIEYRLPIVAANVSRNDTRRVLKDGLPSLGFDARVPADIRAAQAGEIADSHCGMLDDGTAARMVGAQVARDQFMARAIEANAARGAVLIAGNGHVRRDVGVPRWLSEATSARSVSIGLLEPGDPNAAAFDVVVTTPAQPRPDPCESMRAAPKR
ncbi:MAG: ChaN family lipoprotein [Burkholderiales bacterium]